MAAHARITRYARNCTWHQEPETRKHKRPNMCTEVNLFNLFCHTNQSGSSNVIEFEVEIPTIFQQTAAQLEQARLNAASMLSCDSTASWRDSLLTVFLTLQGDYTQTFLCGIQTILVTGRVSRPDWLHDPMTKPIKSCGSCAPRD